MEPLRASIYAAQRFRESISKSKEVTASSTQFFFGSAADLAKSELIILPGNLDLSLIRHCICMLFCKIDCLRSVEQQI